MAIRQRAKQIGLVHRKGSFGPGVPKFNQFVVVGKPPKFSRPRPKRIGVYGASGETPVIEELSTTRIFVDRRKKKGTSADRKKAPKK